RICKRGLGGGSMYLKRLTPLLVFVLFSLNAMGEDCLQGFTTSGRQDLRRPWPIDIHGERHTQIQQAIGRHSKNVQFCFERFGDLPAPIQFTITADGFAVDIVTIKSLTAQCLAKMLVTIQLPKYPCELNVPYQWDGQLPLVNAERRVFP